MGAKLNASRGPEDIVAVWEIWNSRRAFEKLICMGIQRKALRAFKLVHRTDTACASRGSAIKIVDINIRFVPQALAFRYVCAFKGWKKYWLTYEGNGGHSKSSLLLWTKLIMYIIKWSQWREENSWILRWVREYATPQVACTLQTRVFRWSNEPGKVKKMR